MEVTIGLISALLGMALGYLGFMRNRDKDVAGRAAENAVVTTKLDNINTGVNQIQLDLRAQAQRMDEFNGRLIRVEKDVEATKGGLQAVNERVDKIGDDRR